MVAGGGDGQAAGLGAHALSAGRAYCNLGTAAVAGVGTEQYRADLAFRTMTSCVPRAYVCEALVRSGTSLVSWFVTQFGRPAYSTRPPHGYNRGKQLGLSGQRRGTRPCGQRGADRATTLARGRTPYWDVNARGAAVGWTPAHTSAHFYRALLEGLAMELRLTLDGIAWVTGEPITHLVLTGGGARSTVWRQIMADVTGRVVVLVASTELTRSWRGNACRRRSWSIS